MTRKRFERILRPIRSTGIPPIQVLLNDMRTYHYSYAYVLESYYLDIMDAYKAAGFPLPRELRTEKGKGQ